MESPKYLFFFGKDCYTLFSMKKIFLIIFLILFFAPLLAQAADWLPLVPCGGCAKSNPTTGECITPQPACQFCHFFVLFKNIVNFFLFDIVPVLAALMIVIAGLYFFLAGQNPAMLTKARDILTATLWGLIIIYGAWIFVNMFLTFPGLINASWGWNPANWFQIDCPTP